MRSLWLTIYTGSRRSGGTFLQMLSASRNLRIGFAVDGVAMLETDARYAGYSPTQAGNVYEELRRRVAALRLPSV